MPAPRLAPALTTITPTPPVLALPAGVVSPPHDRTPSHRWRTSFWSRTFDTARSGGGWMRVDRLYTRATASQIASDIACAHRRDPALHRVRGMFAAEQWEAIWAPAENGPPGDHVVWVRLVPLR